MAQFPRHITFDEMIELAPKEGLILEFGVYQGNTLGQFSEILDRLGDKRTIYGFDSFEGLPEDWNDIHRRGRFATKPPAVRPNCELVIGMFQNTLDKFLESHQGPLAFANMDADLYSSTIYVLDRLAPRMKLGSILHFDEIQKEQYCEDHEQRAFLEFLNRYRQEWIYLGQQRLHTAAFMCVRV